MKDVNYSLTLFNSLFDTKTDKRVDIKNFDQFERLLYKLSTVELPDKKSAQLMSPATYSIDSTRKNDSVLTWGSWAAVDVDDMIFDGDVETILKERFKEHKFICYSTASSTEAQPKFRLVFPLTCDVHKDDIKKLWYALQTELGDLGDRQTKDLSRMYYIPAKYKGANNFIFSHLDGSDIDPDELIAKHPMPERSSSNNFFDRLPSNIQSQIIQHRKDSMDATYEWSSYQNCPFWPKKLAAEYISITSTGWYSKMYAIMVATAGNATKKKYPISAYEIATLCQQFDLENGNWYENRPLDKEADRALEYVYKNM